MRERLRIFLFWAVAIAILAAIAHFVFGLRWWIAVAGGLIAMVGNALLIEWEDRQPGGWSE